MAKSKHAKRYPKEFHRQMVELHRGDEHSRNCHGSSGVRSGRSAVGLNRPIETRVAVMED